MATRTEELDLQTFRGPKSTVFTGRPQGEDARKKLDLEKKDGGDFLIRFRLPADTTTITPSFFLGLLYESIKKIGVEGYRKKYLFDLGNLDADRAEILKKDIAEGERNAINSISGRRGLSFLLNPNK